MTEHRSNRLLGCAALGLAVFGAMRVVHAQTPGDGPPQPPASAVGQLFGADDGQTPAGVLAPLDYSMPVHIDVPAIGVHADIMSLGLGPDNSLAVPPLSQAKQAGWYDRSPAPGQNGASIIDAHVDSALMKDYRGAFFTLGQARPGQEVDVVRADHSVAVFTIDSVQLALKTAFPDAIVYAPVPYPALRLITCGGGFDAKTHEYLGNTIVYAHLAATRSQ
jgi:Sortase domain